MERRTVSSVLALYLTGRDSNSRSVHPVHRQTPRVLIAGLAHCGMLETNSAIQLYLCQLGIGFTRRGASDESIHFLHGGGSGQHSHSSESDLEGALPKARGLWPEVGQAPLTCP